MPQLRDEIRLFGDGVEVFQRPGRRIEILHVFGHDHEYRRTKLAYRGKIVLPDLR